MTATWPGMVRQAVSQDAYGEQRDKNIAEFKPEVGRAIRRRRTSLNESILNCQQRLTAAEWAALDTFAHTTLADGTLPFNWTHPRTGNAGVFWFETVPSLVSVSGLIYTVKFTARLISGG